MNQNTRSNQRTIEKIKKFLLDVVLTDERDYVVEVDGAYRFKKLNELTKREAQKVAGWHVMKDGSTEPIMLDKLKSAEILLKYLSKDDKENNVNNDRVIIVGEGEILD